MQDSNFMRIGDGSCHISYIASRVARFERTFRQFASQIGTRNIVHGEKVMSLVFTTLIDRHDVSVGQLGSGSSFGIKPGHFIFAGKAT